MPTVLAVAALPLVVARAGAQGAAAAVLAASVLTVAGLIWVNRAR